MGTNYHITAPPSCGGKCDQHCHAEEIHLGKSSAGWAFTFRAYPDPDAAPQAITWPVTDFASWHRLLSLGAISDEYGREVSAEDLLVKIEGKRGGLNTSYPELRDFLDDADNRFIPREFS